MHRRIYGTYDVRNISPVEDEAPRASQLVERSSQRLSRATWATCVLLLGRPVEVSHETTYVRSLGRFNTTNGPRNGPETSHTSHAYRAVSKAALNHPVRTLHRADGFRSTA